MTKPCLTVFSILSHLISTLLHHLVHFFIHLFIHFLACFHFFGGEEIFGRCRVLLGFISAFLFSFGVIVWWFFLLFGCSVGVFFCFFVIFFFICFV